MKPWANKVNACNLFTLWNLMLMEQGDGIACNRTRPSGRIQGRPKENLDRPSSILEDGHLGKWV